MKYRFSIDEATVEALKPHVELEMPSDDLAYKYIIDEVINNPENLPLKRGTLWKQGAFGWEALMIWRKGSGWAFPDGRASNIEDNRIAPGA